jgi:arabinan endo-1,5-alpha-L-arabinosidase
MKSHIRYRSELPRITSSLPWAFVAPLLAIYSVLAASAAETNLTNTTVSRPEPSSRSLFVHDPSTVMKCKGEYWFFSTGPGISSRHSRDLVTWEEGSRVFATPPAWTTNAVPEFRGHFWAPDILYLTNRYLLYYSVSTWGKNTSAIGLASNPTLDPTDPNFRWTDHGVVIQTTSTNNFNAIDPCVAWDAEGKLWLGFGSFWSGIKLIQLDPSTGKRLAPDSPIHSLAWHNTIEAPYLYRHGEHYYLFVNWGLCARGTNSTYNIRVGRSSRITGPYLDQSGVDLLKDGGTLFLGSTGQFFGPGHASFYVENGTNWVGCHYYDGKRRGAPTYAIGAMRWDADGWPIPFDTSPFAK